MYNRKQVFQGIGKERHLRGLKSFAEEYNVKKLILVSNDPSPRKVGKIMIMPWKFFLDQLWDGGLIG